MPVTIRDNSSGAEIIVLPLARLPAVYSGLCEARLRAQLRRDVMDLPQADLIELAHWLFERSVLRPTATEERDPTPWPTGRHPDHRDDR